MSDHLIIFYNSRNPIVYVLCMHKTNVFNSMDPVIATESGRKITHSHKIKKE